MYTENRPRGSFTILDEWTNYKVKKITVLPNQILSLQSHKHRSEHRTIVNGIADVTIWPDLESVVKHTIQSGWYIFIPQWYIHRIANNWNADIVFIEVQNGKYLGEDDINRYEDIYGRKNIEIK